MYLSPIEIKLNKFVDEELGVLTMYKMLDTAEFLMRRLRHYTPKDTSHAKNSWLLRVDNQPKEMDYYPLTTWQGWAPGESKAKGTKGPSLITGRGYFNTMSQRRDVLAFIRNTRLGGKPHRFWVYNVATRLDTGGDRPYSGDFEYMEKIILGDAFRPPNPFHLIAIEETRMYKIAKGFV